jgi:hypothetical protein
VDSESAFTGFEACQCFYGSIRYVFDLKITKQEKAGRVGMSSHGDFVRARQNVQCGMFECVITPSFENEREIE